MLHLVTESKIGMKSLIQIDYEEEDDEFRKPIDPNCFLN